MRDFITWNKPSKTGDRRKWVTLRHYYSFTLISQSTLHIKSNLCFVYWVWLCFFFFFFFLKDMHYNTMIRMFCIMKKMTFTAFHYLNLSIRCEELDTLTVFISEKHILWIHFGENFIDIWGGADFGPYSSQSFDDPELNGPGQKVCQPFSFSDLDLWPWKSIRF
jgi:hypothetical protein